LFVAAVATAAALIVASRGGRAQQRRAPFLLGSLVTVTSRCCGGVARPAGQVCSTTSALAGQVVVRRGRVNRGPVIAAAQTDAAASSRRAATGSYCVVGPDKSAGAGRQLTAQPAGYTTTRVHDANLRTCDAIATVPARASSSASTMAASARATAVPCRRDGGSDAALERFGAADDLHQLFGDRGLAGTVVLEASGS